MTNQNLFSGKIVVVAKSGTADYRTIGDAIQNVEPNTRILVQPGVYRESIVINKPLEILGDGQVSRIVIEAADASCIVMQTKSSLVRGLTLRNVNREKEHKYFAVNISQGKLILEDCDITSNSYGCVLITGSTTNPEIRRCRIHDGKRHGISIRDNGLGTIEDCDIYGNTYRGINIDNGGNPTISYCRIYDGKSSGIWITKNGLGTIEDCDIYGNTYRGIYIYNGGNPCINRCRIYDHKRNGISIKENGLGTIEDCDIYGNTHTGIYIDNGGNPRINRCRIYDNKGNGIAIKTSGLGTIEDCDIYRNAGIGVLISDKGSNPTLRRYHIHHGKEEAISIQKLS